MWCTTKWFFRVHEWHLNAHRMLLVEGLNKTSLSFTSIWLYEIFTKPPTCLSWFLFCCYWKKSFAFLLPFSLESYIKFYISKELSLCSLKRFFSLLSQIDFWLLVTKFFFSCLQIWSEYEWQQSQNYLSVFVMHAFWLSADLHVSSNNSTAQVSCELETCDWDIPWWMPAAVTGKLRLLFHPSCWRD